MDSIQLAQAVANVLEDRHANDVEVIDIAEQSSIADYFVIATAKNTAHVRALAEEVEEKIEAEGITVTRTEGIRDGRWAVLDYGNVLVHIFNADTREFYCLEKLWKDHKVIVDEEEE